MSKSICATPDLDGVTAISDIDPLPTKLRDALAEAKEFISFYEWVLSIKSEYLGFGVDGIVYAFLFEILPGRPDVDQWVWVIVGDVPPAYITCEHAKNPYEALDAYIGAMEEWVEAARTGMSVANLIPVNVPATPSNAELLDRRLKFIDKEILPSLQ